jgi:hypothetical protein
MSDRKGFSKSNSKRRGRPSNVSRPAHIKPMYFNPRLMSADEITDALMEYWAKGDHDESTSESDDA